MAPFKKQRRSPLNERSQALFIWMLYKIIPFFPLKVSYALARRLSDLSLLLLRKQKRTIFGNLEVAFGNQMGEAQKREIAGAMATGMFKGFFECFYLASPFRDKVKDIGIIEGRHHLEEARARGRGVIVLSAHFGNFIILGSLMAQHSYPFYMVLKDPPGRPLADLFQKFRKSSGQQWITTTPWGECQKKILRCLRNNEIVCLIADEYKRHGGVEVDFFGHKTPTAVGPAVLSLRTGAAIVPLFMVRQHDDTHRIIIEPALTPALTGIQSEDIYRITAAFTRRIEWYVRRYPDQWLWLNRRWKKRSPGDKHYDG